MLLTNFVHLDMTFNRIPNFRGRGLSAIEALHLAQCNIVICNACFFDCFCCFEFLYCSLISSFSLEGGSQLTLLQAIHSSSATSTAGEDPVLTFWVNVVVPS